jgi:preprotein translocase subunit YajC
MNSNTQTLMMAPAPTGASGQTQAPAWASMVPLVLMFVIFYFLLIRPQQKRAKEHQKMVDAIDTGDEVVTAGGILGTVTNRKEKTLIVKIAENVKIEVLKSAVQTVKKSDGTTSSIA